MNENVIEFLRDQKTATVTFCQKKFINKIKDLADKFPDECRILKENEDGSIVAHIPVKWIKVNNPQRKPRDLSDEEREVLRNRMKLARQKRKEKLMDKGK